MISFAIRKALGLAKETEVSFEVKNNEIRIKKLPTVLDWTNLVKGKSPLVFEIDENGHYNPKKSPDFHDWMVND